MRVNASRTYAWQVDILDIISDDVNHLDLQNISKSYGMDMLIA